MQEDGSISVTVMDDNAAQVEEYALADDWRRYSGLGLH